MEHKKTKNNQNQFIQTINLIKNFIIYNDNKEKEIKSTYLNAYDKVSKINIIIDYQFTSFYGLFYKC